MIYQVLKKLANWFLTLSLLLFSYAIYAEDKVEKEIEQVTGFGGVAKNLMEPVNLLANFLDSACLLLGGAFIFASVIKFVEHRRSPLMVPISTVVFLLLSGIFLILLPLVYKLTDSGIPTFY